MEIYLCGSVIRANGVLMSPVLQKKLQKKGELYNSVWKHKHMNANTHNWYFQIRLEFLFISNVE